MKPIKFDLRMKNDTRIATLEDLEENLTPEILEHFRSGKLLKWLRARDLNVQAERIEALNSANVQDEVTLFIKLCEVFEREVDEEDALDMIEDYKSALAESVKVSSEAIEEIEQTESEQQTTVEYEEPEIIKTPAIAAVVETKVEVKTTPVKPKEFVINQKLLAVLAREKKPFYVMNDIPTKKLKNAINAYGGGGVEFETPLILLDATFFGSATDGFLLTTESLSLQGTTSNLPLGEKAPKFSILLKDIREMSVIASDYLPTIKINGKSCEFSGAANSAEDNWKAFKAFFKDYLSL